MVINILITFFLVFLNAFFVAAEFSLVKIRESQIELKIRNGSKLASVARFLTLHMGSTLSATQLGITLTSLALGWIGEPVVANLIIQIIALFGFNINPSLAHSIALPAAFVSITFLHIVFGELAPKSMAIQTPEKVALLIALPLRFFYFVFRPFIWILNTAANFILKTVGFSSLSEMEQLHSADELRYLLEESSKSGIIDISDHTLLDNIFEFSDKDIKQIMVPRGKIVGVELSMTLDEIRRKFIAEGYSRMPVYDTSIDNITGIVNAKDLLGFQHNDNDSSLEKIIRKAFFVNEEEHINKLLNFMKRNKIHIVVVIDEFGGTSGIVTMEDIIEEIVGEIQDEYDDEQPLIEKINDKTYIIKATATIDDVNDFLEIDLPESEDYDTVGGLIMSSEGRIPEMGEIIQIGNFDFQIIKRSHRFIETVKLFNKNIIDKDEK